MRLLSWIHKFKDDFIKYKCLCCNKSYQHKFDEKLKEQYFNIYKSSNYYNTTFISLLQKGVYRYECMDDWEKFSETSLPKKQNLCSPLNTEDITDSNDTHTKRVCKDFEIKNLEKTDVICMFKAIHYC